jgi:DNA-binding transcriptional ArsR family regulator
MKQISEIDDPRLVKGLAHPLRIAILRVLQDRVASPSEIAEEIDAPLGNVSYHVRFLARVGLIELTGTRPRRGAVEHYYRALGRVAVSPAAWAQVPQPVRDSFLSATLDQVGRSVGAAAAAGGFSHDEAHASRIEVTLDAAGFSDLSSAVAELHAQAVRIELESAQRIAERGDVMVAATPTDDDRVRAELVLMLFGSESRSN